LQKKQTSARGDKGKKSSNIASAEKQDQGSAASRKKLDNGLTPAQMKDLLKLLGEKRDELKRSINQLRDRDSKIDPSEIIEELEQASTGQTQDVQLRILDKEVKLLREVERALKKFEKEEYGLCEATQEPIGYARLKARPWARYSVTHKEELERAQREQSTLRPGR
jgi:DnaK suppressor protein